MAIKLTQEEKEQAYFCTFTCLDWIHLFEIVDVYDEIYKLFNILLSRQHQITGFVIMPNHLHLLVHIAQGTDRHLAQTSRCVPLVLMLTLNLCLACPNL